MQAWSTRLGALVVSKGPAPQAPWIWARNSWLGLEVCTRAAWPIQAECQPGKKSSAQWQSQPNAPPPPCCPCQLMFTGSRRKGCGVRSLLTKHSYANVDCHQGSPRIAGSQQSPPIYPQVVGTASPTGLQPGGSLLHTADFQASQRKLCLAPPRRLSTSPCCPDLQWNHCPWKPKKGRKEPERRLQELERRLPWKLHGARRGKANGPPKAVFYRRKFQFHTNQVQMFK